MKKILIVLLFFTTQLYTTEKPSEEKPFVIIICSYNNKKWYKFNLHSVFRQWYSNYRVIYIDDASTDGTGMGVQDYIRQKKQKSRVTYIRNQERCGACANTYNAVWQCDEKEIVVILDGDDWFECPNALQALNFFYHNPDVWMTYGQYRYYPSEKLPQDLDRRPIDFKQFDRTTTPWRVHYPRTFYAKLFHLIAKEDLMYEGSFLPIAADVGYMLPMFEMCGTTHAKYINKVLAYYNRGTSINDNKVNKQLQKRLEHYIREKASYEAVDDLWQA